MARSSGEISGELFQRYRGNPLLSPERWPYAANAVMNAGAAQVDGSTVLLCRVEDRRGISHLTVARSRNGVSNWVVDEDPLLAPDPALPHEAWGLEDPRLTWVDDLDSWVIAFTSFGPGGPGLSLALTQDFRSVERLGMVRAPEDKNGGAAAAPHRWRVRLAPPPGHGPDRTGPTSGSRAPATCIAGHRRSRCWQPGPEAGGTRPGSGSGRRRSKPQKAGS